ncbi:efflux RND transporter periplasmic adaptor subunit [Spongiivirga citrea]|uniref:HlyD family efflux transporter periplasmic adaptor subunit n=1 Tax=Spongiivirga citrea TaxID=1481457 RepID=A0A6M0CFY2_9FLAO|nr:HlyD family secretion protein [Spongiivirga citrea]NER15783.1 HlyD family efflux transporter periplasmic adaptor subunit [Spongiivirga citrea]
MKNRKVWIPALIVLLIISSYFLISSKDDENVMITAEVTSGEFIDEVFISGELQSTSLQKIKGPANLRRFRLNQIKIQDLVPEGTIVKKGDYVGKLDPSGVNELILDAQLNLETAQSKYTQQQLDTTLTLKQERNAVKDLKFQIEETQLELKQSIYEPPATIRKLEINLEKKERDLREKEENYSIKKRQADAKMIEVGTEVSKNKKKLADLVSLQETFTIYTDSPGMITYVKNWDGGKRKVGGNISPWDPAIASLPDLTKMESKTYANEVDIRKIKKGLPVKIGFDAFPEMEIEGVVTEVANVGEKKRGSDVKLFQILVKLNNTNDALRPGMTTSNRIITNTKKDVLSAPLESVFTKDSTNYVFKKSGFSIVKQEVELGEANNDHIIIAKGLKSGDVVYLNKPDGYEDASIKAIE